MLNHAITLTFSIQTEHEEIEDISVEALRQALQNRIEGLDFEGDLAWYDACEIYDTYEVEE